ncbi:tripartite tricarboxylate transporter permease [Oceanobacillus timonensis]|uniref:tripartite tricarboxylate transporter permease n=1 Tax=Oceanobacillus timonensis TaxID=1926285 RepID=UPI001180E52B|nr:tripartite tricarboxylate transporter permease [Oceanobacillus timonensis]
MELLGEGLLNVLEPTVFIVIVLGILVGMFIGAIPGLTATMGVAVMLPVTFGMEPLSGLLLLIGVYFGGIYGGSLTAILLRTPGTPSSAATVIDGYPMTQRGEGDRALIIALVASFVGGIIGVLVLIFISPQIAKFALEFRSPETFGLAVFGLSIIASVSGKSILKGIIAALIGLFIASVGLDPVTAQSRFTFGSTNLSGGIELIPALIGLFAAAEAFRMIHEEKKMAIPQVKYSHLFRHIFDTFRGWVNLIRSSLIGVFIGIIPGAGADIASFVSYNEAKRWTRRKSTYDFGEGKEEGVAAPESANNGLTAGAFVPLLTLGIPGDAVAAVMLGALIIQGVRPGPQIFETNGELVYSIFSGMLVSYLILFIVGLICIKYFVKILDVPKILLAPIVLTICVVGAFAVNNNYFDVYVMLATAILGYFLIKLEIPVSPIIIALILGPMAEREFRRALVVSDGSYTIFLQSPIALTLIILAALSFFLPILQKYIKNKKEGRR